MTIRDSEAWTISGAFAPVRILAGIDRAIRRRLFSGLAEAGLSHLLTEGPSIPAWLLDEAADAGLRLGGGIACFSDHGGPVAVSETLRPITPKGTPRPKMEWYQGIVPTDRGYELALLEEIEKTLADLPSDLFVLDFIRWPIHWEIELRDGHQVVDSSFDAVTLRRFREEMNVDLPIDTSKAATIILSEMEHSWAEFKCRVIDEIAGKIADIAREVRPDVVLGAYVVPGTDEERRRFAGQDVSRLGRHLDVLLPMTYHAILHRPPSWVGDVVADVFRRGATPTIPVVQTTADPKVSGPNDWGRPFPAEELGAAIDAGLDAGGRGFVVFPAHGLDPVRLRLLSPRASRAAGMMPTSPSPDRG